MRASLALLACLCSLWWRQVGVLHGVFDPWRGEYSALFVEEDEGESGF